MSNEKMLELLNIQGRMDGEYRRDTPMLLVTMDKHERITAGLSKGNKTMTTDSEQMQEFHNHELMEDASHAECQKWLDWVDKVETLVGHHLDGDQRTDGYSLDYTFEMWDNGLSTTAAAEKINAGET